MNDYTKENSWENKEGVRTFKKETEKLTEIFEIDTIEMVFQSFEIYNETNESMWTAYGEHSRGGWDEVETVEEFVQYLTGEGYTEVIEEG